MDRDLGEGLEVGGTDEDGDRKGGCGVGGRGNEDVLLYWSSRRRPPAALDDSGSLFRLLSVSPLSDKATVTILLTPSIL